MKNELDIIEKIRSRYTENKEKEVSKLEELKELDRKVKKPAKVFGYTFGAISSLVLGTGMSLAMKIIGTSISFVMPLGIGVGLIGILFMSLNYKFYKSILNKGIEKYGQRIIELSNAILNN